MTTFAIAHVRQSGQDMIIVPMHQSFGSKTSSEQDDFIEALEDAAWDAGMAGHVVAIWQERGQTSFVAPSEWYSFFESEGIWEWVQDNINTDLTV